MSILQEVLRSHKPHDWEDANYNSDRYHNVRLYASDAGYQSVVDKFAGIPISHVERVQNPYILGRYILRKEQLQLRRGCTPSEITVYHPVFVADIPTVCEHNCDCRRYSKQVNACGCSSRIPRFYKTAKSAVDSLNAYSGEKAIVVVSVLDESNEYSSIITKDNDTEFCPKYIVYLN